MSHVISILTQVRDPEAVRAACERLRLPAPQQGSFKLFSDQVSGLGVHLREWRFPVVFQTDTGEVRYDNFGGKWGDRHRLDELIQAYAVEKTRLEARKKGYSVTEQTLSDGTIKLAVHMGGIA